MATAKQRPKARPGSKSSPYRVAATRPRAEELPTAGGRLLAAAVIVLLMVFIPFAPIPDSWFEKSGPPPTDYAHWKVGDTANVRISVITADYNYLSCVLDKAVAGAHCAFQSETSVWPPDEKAPLDDNKKDVIQPYWTFPDNRMLLVAGFWANPVVAMRLHDEPPAGVPSKKLARFVVSCKMRFVGETDAVKVRWNPGQAWSNGGKALIAKPESCEIEKNQD